MERPPDNEKGRPAVERRDSPEEKHSTTTTYSKHTGPNKNILNFPGKAPAAARTQLAPLYREFVRVMETSDDERHALAAWTWVAYSLYGEWPS